MILRNQYIVVSPAGTRLTTKSHSEALFWLHVPGYTVLESHWNGNSYEPFAAYHNAGTL